MVGYTKPVRGVIQNREAAKRINDFSGLRWGRITPTDIDLFLDFQNKVFIVGEGKTEGVPIKPGQGYALQRVTDACAKVGYSLLIVWDVPLSLVGDVPVHNMVVRSSYQDGAWNNKYRGATVKNAMGMFRERCGM